MEVIEKESKEAFLYLKAIDQKLWTRVYAPYPKWGHDTSNIIESLNSSWSDIRNLPPLRLVDAIYSASMRLVYLRFKEPQQSLLLADIPMAKFKARQDTARRYQVYESGNGIYQVEPHDSTRQYIVDLIASKCNCQDFYEYQLPCSHAIAAARYGEVDPISLFFDRYTVRALRRTYECPLVPILLENLAIDFTIAPPILKKQAGRPKTKRIRKGAWKRKQTRCSTCLDWGHNKGTCRSQPVSSGRRQRARDWLEEADAIVVELGELEVDEEGDIDSDISSELSDLGSSDIEEIELVDILDENIQEVEERRATKSSTRIG
jgi:hypothetical protein